MSFSHFTTGANSEVNFIPEIYSKLLQAKFYATSILPSISNTDYDSEISGQGDKVHIRTVPTVSISDYTGDLTYEKLGTANVELNIDRAKSFAFKSDDILVAQSNIEHVKESSADAAEQMRIAVETDVLASVVVGAGTIKGKTTITEENVLAKILELATDLDKLDVPEQGRYLVLTPDFCSLLKLSPLRQAYMTGDAVSPLRNGNIGVIDRFTVFQSNMLYTPKTGGAAGHTHVLAGHPKAICFASQFVKTETLRLESSFGDAVRGLKVYGSKVIVPDALVVGKWTLAA